MSKKGNPKMLPCSLCKRTRPPFPGEELKTSRCTFGCGFPLPGLDAQDPKYTALLAAADQRKANNAKVSVPGAIVDEMVGKRDELIFQLRASLAEWFDPTRDSGNVEGMVERGRAALKASENWKTLL